MKISVCIPTYNHGQFIAQAIESALNQDVSFDFEILIGEDDSSDNTREIVKTYKERYPEKIRLFLNDRSNVIYIDGRPTGRWNIMNLLANAKGEYVALLDGDDYWLSKRKLHSQVEFLDTHQDHSMCFHPVYIHNPQGTKEYRPKQIKSSYTLDDFLSRGSFIATCSVVYRKEHFEELPNWFREVHFADWALHAICAQHGPIGYMDELMGVYRMHAGGMWSSRDKITRLNKQIESRNIIFEGLDLRHLNGAKLGLANSHKKLAVAYRQTNQKKEMRQHTLKAIRYHPQKSPKDLLRYLRLYLSR